MSYAVGTAFINHLQRFSKVIAIGAVALLLVATFARCLPWQRQEEGRSECQPPDERQAEAFARDENAPVPIIFDTDFAPDVDDVGALAILHALADRGEASILGVVISSGNMYAARAVDAINTYYGRPDIPIGMTWNPTVTTDSLYTMALALDFPNDIQAGLSSVVPEAIEVYRQLLAAQRDKSVTIVSVGFLTNLRDLLDSEPDEFSNMPGRELVAAKVARLVVMGGHYPDSALPPDGAEYNFAMDAEAAYIVVTRWPTPMIFSGFELGVDIETGAVLQQTPPKNPVRRAYELYTGGSARSSWDLTAVHYAVRGSAGGYQLCAGGSNDVSTDGHNRWDTSVLKPQAYLSNSITKEEIKNVLDDLLVQPPRGFAP